MIVYYGSSPQPEYDAVAINSVKFKENLQSRVQHACPHKRDGWIMGCAIPVVPTQKHTFLGQ